MADPIPCTFKFTSTNIQALISRKICVGDAGCCQ